MDTVTVDPLALLKWLVGIIAKLRSEARADAVQYRDRVYRTFVEPAFNDLVGVHKDYTKNLSKLCARLEEGTTPPLELAAWLRKLGLVGRVDRDGLRTMRAELDGVDFRELARGTGHDEILITQAMGDYVRAISQYFAAADVGQLSPYRYFEEMLREKGVIGSYEGPGRVDSVVYTLRQVVDYRLPQQWREVRTRYGALRAALGFPMDLALDKA